MTGQQTIEIPVRTLKRARLRVHYDKYQAALPPQKPATFVPGEGSLNAAVVFVGEAPGRTEDQEGRPFIGPAGRVLDELLCHAGLARGRVFITNLLKYRPPGNRDPAPAEAGPALALLRTEIEIIDPDVVVTLGRISAQLYFRRPHMPSIVGRVHVKAGRVVVPLYHPAVAVYDRAMMQQMKEHIRAVADALEDRRTRG